MSLPAVVFHGGSRSVLNRGQRRFHNFDSSELVRVGVPGGTLRTEPAAHGSAVKPT